MMLTPSRIDCACGFAASGPDQAQNREAFAEHECFTEDQPARWFEAVFSFWGAAIVFLLAAATVGTLTGKGWPW